MKLSHFENDLSKENLLGKYLDGIYLKLFDGFTIKRVSDVDEQHRGIDIIIFKDEKEYYIDEKAQLDYLEIDLPTFAFEISYLKNGFQKNGWLFDKTKITDKYFLITSIFCNTEKEPESGFKNCKIFSVDRVKLIKLLQSKELNYQRISEINQEIRDGNSEGRIPTKELNSFTEGNFHFTKSGKVEEPINIILKLDFLMKSGVAKKLY